MADVFNKEPVEFVDLNELFPVLNSAVGLTYEQFRILVENTFWLKNQEEIGVVKAFIVSGSSQFGSLWLSETDGGAPLIPNAEYIYIVQTNGNFKNKLFSWNGSIYEQLAKDSDNNYTNADKQKVDKLKINGDGTKYLSDDGEYSIVEAGISEAPQDNKLYGRKNADWEEITADIPSRIQNEDNTNYVDTENAYVNLNITTTSYESIFRKRLTEFLVSFQRLDQPGQNYGNPKTEFRINPNGFYIDVMSDMGFPVDSPYGRYNFGEIGKSEDRVARIRDLQQIIDTIVGE